jgi:hypothetical protein
VKKLAVMSFAATLLVAGCGGGGGGGSSSTAGKVIGGSNNTSVCAYAKPVAPKGRVFVEMSVSPTSLEPAACSDLNDRLGGREIPMNGKLGTGQVYCRWNRFESSSRTEIGVFASGRRAARAFCRSFDPGPGFKPYP